MSSTIASKKPLTQMQVAFCQHYIKNGFSAHAAAIDAGYSLHVARHATDQIAAKPKIRNALQKSFEKAEQKILDKLGVSYEWRVNKLKRIIDSVIPNSDTEEIRMPFAKVAISAIAEINKMGGDYAPDKSLRLTVDMTKERMAEAKKVYDDF